MTDVGFESDGPIGPNDFRADDPASACLGVVPAFFADARIDDPVAGAGTSDSVPGVVDDTSSPGTEPEGVDRVADITPSENYYRVPRGENGPDTVAPNNGEERIFAVVWTAT